MQEPTIEQLELVALWASENAPGFGATTVMDASEAVLKWAAELRVIKDNPGEIIALAEEVMQEQGMSPWPTIRVLELSTAHVSYETSLLMNDHKSPVSMLDDKSHGWWVLVYYDDLDEVEQDYPEDLKHVLATARGLGYRWVRFDQDADQVADLPTFDW